MKYNSVIILLITSTLMLVLISTGYGIKVDFKISPDKENHPISPHVYGVNGGNGIRECPVRRSGGNRMTGYNWENNASSAGSDWQHYNDFWLCEISGISAEDCKKPGYLIEHFVRKNKSQRADSLITIQMAGYVAADGNKAVTEAEAAPSPRWKKIVVRKGSPLSLKPDLNDDVIYMDEFINFLINKFGKAEEGGVGYYSLDNEPALWPNTHPRIHPDKTGYEELVKRSAEMGEMIVTMDPSAKIVGPVLYGYWAYVALQDAPDRDKFKEEYPTFCDYYLAKMKEASDKAGKRLLHFFDLHWYPEARGTDRICFQANPEIRRNKENVIARLQAPRSLWDPTYQEVSWITTDVIKRPINLFNEIQEKIDKHFPGTKIACTEYNFGATDHISGGLAQIDVLGIFGKYDVLGAKWGGDGDGSYTKAAFRMYLSYDYRGSKYGDIYCASETSDLENSSIWASKYSKKTGMLAIIAVNKNLEKNIKGTFTIEKAPSIDSMKVYRLDQESTEIKNIYRVIKITDKMSPKRAERAKKRIEKMAEFAPKIEENTFEYKLPPLSATLFIIQLQ